MENMILNIVMALIIGFLGGVGTIHLTIVRRLATQEQKTLTLEKGHEDQQKLIGEQLKLLTKIVSQNDILIHKLTVERGR